MMHIRSEVIELEKRNRDLKDEVERRKRHIKSLEEDPAERERAVREGTNKQRPDETTIYLSEEPEESPKP